MWWRRGRRTSSSHDQSAGSKTRPAPSAGASDRATRRATPPADRPFPTRDGIWVRSLGEQKVANLLSRRRLAYEYEPLVAGLRPDFLLPEHRIVIEYWGGAGFAAYAQRMADKTGRYEAAGYHVVHLLPLHLRELEKVLVEALRGQGIQ